MFVTTGDRLDKGQINIWNTGDGGLSYSLASTYEVKKIVPVQDFQDWHINSCSFSFDGIHLVVALDRELVFAINTTTNESSVFDLVPKTSNSRASTVGSKMPHICMVCCNEFDSKFVVHSNGYYSVFDTNVGPTALWHFPITEDTPGSLFVQGSQAVAFLPDSTLLVATCKCGIRRMDLISGEEIARLDDLESGFSNVTALAQSNSFVAVGTTATILILDSKNWALRLTVPKPRKECLKILQFSGDEQRILGYLFKQSIHIWETMTGIELICYQPTHPGSAGFLFDGTRFVITDEAAGTVAVFDSEIQTEGLKWQAHVFGAKYQCSYCARNILM
jgi:WD40 repeat protein